MHSAKLADTPVKKGLSLSLNQYLKTNDDKWKMSNVPYASAAESLMYIMLHNRPDIFFVLVW